MDIECVKAVFNSAKADIADLLDGMDKESQGEAFLWLIDQTIVDVQVSNVQWEFFEHVGSSRIVYKQSVD